MAIVLLCLPAFSTPRNDWKEGSERFLVLSWLCLSIVKLLRASPLDAKNLGRRPPGCCRNSLFRGQGEGVYIAPLLSSLWMCLDVWRRSSLLFLFYVRKFMFWNPIGYKDQVLNRGICYTQKWFLRLIIYVWFLKWALLYMKKVFHTLFRISFVILKNQRQFVLHETRWAWNVRQLPEYSLLSVM